MLRRGNSSSAARLRRTKSSVRWPASKSSSYQFNLSGFEDPMQSAATAAVKAFKHHHSSSDAVTGRITRETLYTQQNWPEDRTCDVKRKLVIGQEVCEDPLFAPSSSPSLLYTPTQQLPCNHGVQRSYQHVSQQNGISQSVDYVHSASQESSLAEQPLEGAAFVADCSCIVPSTKPIERSSLPKRILGSRLSPHCTKKTATHLTKQESLLQGPTVRRNQVASLVEKLHHLPETLRYRLRRALGRTSARGKDIPTQHVKSLDTHYGKQYLRKSLEPVENSHKGGINVVQWPQFQLADCSSLIDSNSNDILRMESNSNRIELRNLATTTSTRISSWADTIDQDTVIKRSLSGHGSNSFEGEPFPLPTDTKPTLSSTPLHLKFGSYPDLATSNVRKISEAFIGGVYRLDGPPRKQSDSPDKPDDVELVDAPTLQPIHYKRVNESSHVYDRSLVEGSESERTGTATKSCRDAQHDRSAPLRFYSKDRSPWYSHISSRSSCTEKSEDSSLSGTAVVLPSLPLRKWRINHSVRRSCSALKTSSEWRQWFAHKISDLEVFNSTSIATGQESSHTNTFNGDCDLEPFGRIPTAAVQTKMALQPALLPLIYTGGTVSPRQVEADVPEIPSLLGNKWQAAEQARPLLFRSSTDEIAEQTDEFGAMTSAPKVSLAHDVYEFNSPGVEQSNKQIGTLDEELLFYLQKGPYGTPSLSSSSGTRQRREDYDHSPKPNRFPRTSQQFDTAFAQRPGSPSSTYSSSRSKAFI